ncbi:MurR/RpiR family transcriptional regulator [Nocardioidaceae bacterium SCSIO 66511]|nr:MurR/RpiR family transcriptional regulator [Nocardioidaceae bacterium SCSIO 66511]
MGDLSAAERKVARAILSHYPAAGLEPAVQLASRAGASGPTVTRYIARLGFASYRDFQQALREEMDARRAGPMMAPPQFTAETPAGKMLLDSATSGSALLARAFNGIGPSEFDAAVELLTDRRRRVHAVGGRFSGVLATLLDQHLQLLRPNTDVLDIATRSAAVALADIGRRDVVVALDLRRYQRSVVDFCRKAHEHHATVVLMTDQWLSPISEFADVILPLDTDNQTPFDSLVPVAALIETIASGVLAKGGEEAYERMRSIDQESAAMMAI